MTLRDEDKVLLSIPAAPQDATSSRAVVTVRTRGRPLPGAEVLVLFPNRTWVQAVADEDGEAAVDLYTTELPMTVFGAALDRAGRVHIVLPGTRILHMFPPSWTSGCPMNRGHRR